MAYNLYLDYVSVQDSENGLSNHSLGALLTSIACPPFLVLPSLQTCALLNFIFLFYVERIELIQYVHETTSNAHIEAINYLVIS